MRRFGEIVAAAVFLMSTLAGWAGAYHPRSGGSVSYYPGAVNPPLAGVCEPVPILICPPPPVCPPPAGQISAPGYPAPSQQIPAQGYAPPTAAPPSSGPLPVPGSTPAPPLAPPSGSRSARSNEPAPYYDTYAVASPRSDRKTEAPRSRVIFWNLTDHDVTIKLDSRPSVVPRGKSVDLETGRQFVWQVEGRDPQTERIASGESALEIVIRR